MRSIIRKVVLAPVLLAAAVVAVNTAKAEARLDVPFTFSVAGKMCPAGTYTVNRDPLHSIVTLKSKDAKKSFNFTLGPGDDAKPGSVILKFDEIEGSHALRTVQYNSLTTSRLDKRSGHIENISVPMGEGR